MLKTYTKILSRWLRLFWPNVFPVLFCNYKIYWSILVFISPERKMIRIKYHEEHLFKLILSGISRKLIILFSFHKIYISNKLIQLVTWKIGHVFLDLQKNIIKKKSVMLYFVNSHKTTADFYTSDCNKKEIYND